MSSTSVTDEWEQVYSLKGYCYLEYRGALWLLVAYGVLTGVFEYVSLFL